MCCSAQTACKQVQWSIQQVLRVYCMIIKLQSSSDHCNCWLFLKVSKSQKEIMASWILPTSERWGNFLYIKLPQHSFFGRIQDNIFFYWDFLNEKIKSRSFHQYSWNSEVDTTWISLIDWPHKTSITYWPLFSQQPNVWCLLKILLRSHSLIFFQKTIVILKKEAHPI